MENSRQYLVIEPSSDYMGNITIVSAIDLQDLFEKVYNNRDIVYQSGKSMRIRNGYFKYYWNKEDTTSGVIHSLHLPIRGKICVEKYSLVRNDNGGGMIETLVNLTEEDKIIARRMLDRITIDF